MGISTISLGKVKFNWRGAWAAQTTTTLTITGAGVTSTTATLTYATQPQIPFAAGQTIVVAGVTNTAYNGTFVVTGIPSVIQVQYTLSGSPASSSGGTVSSLATATAYTKDDVIRYGGKSYSCLTSHAADANFYVDLASTRWSLMTDGSQWTSSWLASTVYKIGDLVKYGGNIYIANTGHTSSSTIPNFYSDIANWDLYSAGFSWEGAWQGTKFYKINDVISFGGNAYLCNTPHTSGAATTAGWETHESKWTSFVQGQQFEDSYGGSTIYQKGDIVRYGGYLFIATNETTGNLPTNATYWSVFSTGFSNQGTYSNSTVYKPGDLVRYGGLVYVAKSDTTGNNPTNATFWDLVVEGFNWAGTWSSTTTYQKGNVVERSGSSFVSLTSNNLNNIPGSSPSNWELMMQGSGDNVVTTQGDTVYRDSSALTRLAIGSKGKVLKVNPAGTAPEWGSISGDKQFYVDATYGVNSAGYGTVNSPWATIKYACTQITGPAVLFVKAGTYNELLPITVPAQVYVVGDGVRTTFVQATGGEVQKTMWLLSDGCMLTEMTFQGLVGYVPAVGNPEDIANATIGGVYVALNPASPVLTKSPYVVQCSCFSTDTGLGGAVGAIVDGSVHASGNRSMLFHAYTTINDNGVGYWIKNGGKAEIVSCFTYFCHIGYATTGGGKIRALNGNNSYGTYGAVSAGYDTTEVTTNQVGTIYGAQLSYSGLTGGDFSTGNTITGATSGATATVTNVQASITKLYYKLNTGTPFQNNETISNGAGVSAAITSAGLQNQQGFVLVVTGLGAEPKPGASVSIAGDTYSYVIQAVSGTYVNSSSRVVIVLAQEKPSGSANGTGVTIRYAYSQVRLTGHDFLSIGTGGRTSTNYPGFPSQNASQGNEVVETYPGRVYYVSTDQDGNFRVGAYFAVDQATGSATLNANAFNLSGLTSLRLGSIGAQLGELVNEFSSDSTLSGNSNSAVPTEQAVRQYFTKIGTNVLPSTDNTYDLGSASYKWNDIFANGDINFGSTGYMLVPKGTSAQRPGTVSAGYFRYNTDLNTFEGYDGSQWSGIGGGNPWITKTNSDSAYTAVNNDRIFVNTSAAAFTITLPSAPAVGSQIRFVDLAGTFGTNNFTIARNGLNIMGLAENMISSVNHSAFSLVYSGATYGWKLQDN
jgi:hypothetical protein